MKTKSIRSAFLAVVAVFLAAATAIPFAAFAQSAALTAKQRLQKALELRAELDSQIRALEQEREDEEQGEVKTIPVVHQIDIMRERKEKLDRTIKKLKEEAARGAQGANGAKPASASATTNKTAVSASERKPDKQKQMSLVARQAITADLRSEEHTSELQSPD